MVSFLVLDVTDNSVHMAFGIGECAKAFLPCKRSRAKFLCLYPFTAFCFYILYQWRNRLWWSLSNENMYMIGHAVYLKHFVIVFLKDARNILMQFISPCFMNKSSPIFYANTNWMWSCVYVLAFCKYLKLNIGNRFCVPAEHIMGRKNVADWGAFRRNALCSMFEFNVAQNVPMER